MNHQDGDNPDNLGGLGQLLPAEVLEKFNAVLEQLHRAEHPHHGSKITFVYVAAGGQHVESQINIGTASPADALSKGGGGTPSAESTLPDILATEEAMALWEKAKGAGYVDEHYQPLLSRTQSALLADAMAERLGIREKWKTFETLWKRKNMRSDYNLALSQQQTLDFQDELKRIFAA